MRIHHLGVICSDLASSVKKYEDLGFQVSKELLTDVGRNLDYIFISNGNYVFELIAKHEQSKKSDIDLLIGGSKLPGDYIYHTCYETDDLSRDIEKFKLQGYRLVKPPQSAVACEGRKIAFLIHIDFGLIEFIEI